ncbi:zinc ribbon domain-containing protein [Streptomyces flaveolus]|uniref:zinc ribbon domain-containing protein n=1 Tax=Streptomyces flaveolus TaxID=67297 RepID=UPI0036FFBD48
MFQVCSQCGFKDGPKPLHVRVWICGACGAVLDRDINAAVHRARRRGPQGVRTTFSQWSFLFLNRS